MTQVTDQPSHSLQPAPTSVRPRVLRWLVGAIVSLIGAILTYLVGISQILAIGSDVEERCTVTLGQDYEPGFGEVSPWPLSRRCNESYDMVAGWVTPTVVGFLVAALLLMTLTVRARRRAAAATQP